jgi:hypothetical protein
LASVAPIYIASSPNSASTARTRKFDRQFITHRSMRSMCDGSANRTFTRPLLWTPATLFMSTPVHTPRSPDHLFIIHSSTICSHSSAHRVRHECCTRVSA